MAIKYIRKRQEYVGLSTDDKTIVKKDGSVIYYVDTKKREVYYNGTWYEYVYNIDEVGSCEDPLDVTIASTPSFKLSDGTNEITTYEPTCGGYHLGTMVQQVVCEDDNNSSTDNLTSANSYTFTGTGTSTLGVAGLQWNLKTDQNATVYVEQSDDNTNWDVSDSFQYLTSKGAAGNTVQAITSYWRIRVVLDTTVDTTYFRLKGILCPIADPLPRTLSRDERLKNESTLVGQQNTERHVWVSPLSDLMTATRYRLVGTCFCGTTKDTNFWTETAANGGTATQSSGKISLDTNTTANGSIAYETINKARFVSGYPNFFQAGVNFITAETADNVRRVGAFTATDGYFFEYDNTTFSIGSRIGSVDTLVSSGSFNGNYGSTWKPTINTYYRFNIEITPLGSVFYVNNILLHKKSGALQSGLSTLPARIENINSNGSTTNVEFDCIGALISRLGELKTESIYKYLSGAGTTVLKYGAGTLHKIVNNDNSGSVIVYDNTAGSGTIIASVDLAKVLGTLEFDAPFSNGLTAVTSGSGTKVTFIYE